MALEQTYETLAAMKNLDDVGLQTLTIANYRVRELTVKEAVAEISAGPKSMTERFFDMLTSASPERKAG